MARRPAAVLPRSRGGVQRKKRRVARGRIVSFKNFRDLTIKLGFLTVLYLK
jgi:hypothetical protein